MNTSYRSFHPNTFTVSDIDQTREYVEDNGYNIQTLMNIETECFEILFCDGYSFSERMVSKYAIFYCTFIKRRSYV